MTELATKELTAEEARFLTGEIRHRLDGLLPLIKRAYEGRADRALGYESWQAYCAAELNGVRVPLEDRPAAVAELRASGMSTRAIGSAIGISHTEVGRQLRSTGTDVPVQPARITGLDGREQPSTRPTPQTPASTPEPAPATDVDPSARATTPADAQPADDPTTPGADGQADTVFRGTDQAGEQRGPAVELPSPPVRPKPTVDPIDDPEFIKQQRREISTDAVAAALVAIGMQLESDPVRWLNEMWIPGRYRLRDLPRVRDCFTPDGLRTSAKSLELLADHLDATGGSL